jgi:hypothetical protein
VASGVKLEYRDKFGRKLTQREAFREISYRYAGALRKSMC